MNVNLYVIEDYENETALRPKKTNPIKPNFKPPGNEPKKLKRKRGCQELFCVSGLPERLTF